MNVARRIVGAVAATLVLVLLGWIAMRPRVSEPPRVATTHPTELEDLLRLDAAPGSDARIAANVPVLPGAQQVADGGFGVLIRATGSPVPGAQIQVARHSAPRSTLRTDSVGRFQLEDWREIDSLEVWSAGTFPLEFLVADLRRLPIVDGVRWLEVDPACELIVEVQDHAGRVARNARVQVFPADRRTRNRVATRPKLWPLLVDSAAWGDAGSESDMRLATRGVTGYDGRVVVPLVPCGQLLYVTVLATLGEESRVTEVLVEDRSALVVVQFPARAVLTGRFVRPGGEPLGWAQVYLATRPSSNFGGPRAYTDNTGRFTFTGVVPGRHAFVLDAPGEELRHVEVVAPRTDVGDLEVPEPVPLVGRIAPGPFGRPAHYEALFVVVERHGRVLASKFLGPDDHFELDALPGSVDVVLRAGGRTGGVDLDRLSVDLPSPPILLDPHGRTSCLQFEVDPELPPERLSIEIAPSLDAYEPGGNLVIYPRRVIQPRPGLFQVDLLPAGVHSVSIAFDRAGGSVLPRIVLEPGRCADLGRIDVGQGGIAGVVRERDSGAPLPGVALRCHSVASVSPTNGAVYDTLTESDGGFAFQGLPAGVWRLGLPASGLDDPDGATVVVTPGAVTSVDLQVSAPSSLEVLVLAQGTPLGNANVRVIGNGAGHMERHTLAAITDSDGLARFVGLGAATYTVSVERAAQHLSGGNVVRKVLVPAGAAETLVVEFGARLTRFRLFEGGRPFAASRASRLFDARGSRPLPPQVEDPSIVVSEPGPGPWLILAMPASSQLLSELHALRGEPVLPEGFAMCVVGREGEQPADEIDVQLDGANLWIQSGSADAVLPPLEARVVRWPPGSPAWFPTACRAIVEPHPQGGWSVRHVLAGSEIEVQPRRPDPRWPASRFVLTEGASTVTWPGPR